MSAAGNLLIATTRHFWDSKFATNWKHQSDVRMPSRGALDLDWSSRLAGYRLTRGIDRWPHQNRKGIRKRIYDFSVNQRAG